MRIFIRYYDWCKSLDVSIADFYVTPYFVWVQMEEQMIKKIEIFGLLRNEERLLGRENYLSQISGNSCWTKNI